MKAVFVDFDGVFHPTHEIQGKNLGVLALNGAPPILETGLFRWTADLERVLSQCPNQEEIAIVVHSSWRKMSWSTPQLLRDLLGPLSHRFEGIVNSSMPREQSILDFVDRAGIERFVILDDAIAEFDSLAEHVIVTDPLRGMSDPKAQNLVRDWSLEASARVRVPTP